MTAEAPEGWKQAWEAASASERTAFALAIAAAAISIVFELAGYPVIGHDSYVHLNWLDQFTRLRGFRLAYPRWLPGSFGGFGAPTFYFYPPLPYWLAAFLHSVLPLSPSGLFHGVSLFADGLSLGISYAVFQRLGGKRLASLTAALFYSFAAYRFADVFVRNALGEHFALAFLPLLTFESQERGRTIAIKCLAWSAIIFSNVPVALISIVVAGIAAIAGDGGVTGTRGSAGRKIAECAVAGLLALLCTAVYWMPALLLQTQIHSEHLTDLPLNTSTYGFALLDLFQGRVDWLRILTVGTLLAGLAVLLFSEARKGIAFWLLVAGLLFQLPYLSVPLWKWLPGLSLVQFSWRWSVLILLGIGLGVVRRSSPSAAAIGVLSGLTLLCALVLVRYFFLNVPSPLTEYRMDAPEYAPIATAKDPYEMLALTERRMSDQAVLLLGLTSPADSVRTIKAPTKWVIESRLSRATPARLHMLYWPYWKASVGDSAIAIRPDPNGFATLTLPAGEQRLSVVLLESGPESQGLWLTIGGLTLLVLLLGYLGYESIRSISPARGSLPG